MFAKIRIYSLEISPLFPLDFPTEHRYLIRKCVHKESKMSIIFIALIVHNEYEFNQILSMFYKGGRVSKKLTLSIESCKIYKDIYVIMTHR